jgi:hypothetical protein
MEPTIGERDQRIVFNRPALEHRTGGGLQVDPPVERLVESFVAGSIDDNAHGAIVMVFEHIDHGAVEVRIVQGWCGEEQPALRGWGDRKHPYSLPGTTTRNSPLLRPVGSAVRCLRVSSLLPSVRLAQRLTSAREVRIG